MLLSLSSPPVGVPSSPFPSAPKLALRSLSAALGSSKVSSVHPFCIGYGLLRWSCQSKLCVEGQGLKNSGKSGRQVWRRRKLTKKDEKSHFVTERIPFLEEQVRKIRENGKLISLDIERLLLREENKFEFVNEIAAEATAYVENNPDEYGGKKPILHVLSNRVNEAGFQRPEAYLQEDPFRPGPDYLRDHLF